MLAGFPFLKHQADSRALAVATSPLPQESSDSSSSLLSVCPQGWMWGWREQVQALELLGDCEECGSGAEMSDKPCPQTNTFLAQGTASELGNPGSQLTKTSAIPAPASTRNECGPELTIFIFN